MNADQRMASWTRLYALRLAGQQLNDRREDLENKSPRSAKDNRALRVVHDQEQANWQQCLAMEALMSQQVPYRVVEETIKRVQQLLLSTRQATLLYFWGHVLEFEMEILRNLP